MDDVIAFWKGQSNINPDATVAISSWLWSRLCARYPLPLEQDVSGIFIGLSINLAMPGQLDPKVCVSVCNRLAHDHHNADWF